MKLIDKLKKAKEGSRELDAQIAKAFGAEAGRIGKIGWRLRRPGQRWRYLPRYTTCLDDALSLVPDGMYWVAGFGKTREAEPLGGASIMKPGDLDSAAGEGEAATVPLALCLAAILSLQPAP